MSSLKQKILNAVAGGLTMAALSGTPAYASYNDLKSGFGENTNFAFGDVDNDGLTDVIVATDSSVIYFRKKENGNFEYKQKIYTSKEKEKKKIFLIRIKGKMELIIMSQSELKTYKLNERGKFEESKFELEWMEEDIEKEESNPVKNAV